MFSNQREFIVENFCANSSFIACETNVTGRRRGKQKEGKTKKLIASWRLNQETGNSTPSAPPSRFITSFIRHDDDGGCGSEPLRVEHLHRDEVLREDLQPLDRVLLRRLILDADLLQLGPVAVARPEKN